MRGYGTLAKAAAKFSDKTTQCSVTNLSEVLRTQDSTVINGFGDNISDRER